MANMTNTTHAEFVDEVWSKEVQTEFQKSLFMENLVMRFDEDVKSSGDTIHVPQVTGLSANNKSAGSDISYESNTENAITINIDQHKYSAFLLEDITRIQSRYDLRSLYTKEASRALAEAVDSALLGLYSGLSQSVSGGSGIDDTNIISAVTTLDGNDVPRDDRAFVIHSEAMADLLAVDKFTLYDNTGEKGVAAGGKRGRVANVYGTDIYMSNNVVESAGTPNLLHNLMFHKEAFALAKQTDVVVKAQWDIDALGWKVAAYVIYGVAEYRDDAAVDVTLNS